MPQPEGRNPRLHNARRASDEEHGPDEPPNTQPHHDQTSQGDFTSESLFSMYIDRVIEDDDKMVKSWKKDADGILVFTGLFSAATAALISVSITDIRAPPDTTVPFSPHPLSVWANACWILSLCISLTCALLATMLQQWARRYQRVAFPRYRPQKRARVHAFYNRGLKNWRIQTAVEVLPLMLHTSLFVFFSGLSMFMWTINRTIFKVVTTWIGLCFISYVCLSISPIVGKDSPYYTPLSGGLSFCLTHIRVLFSRKQLPSNDPREDSREDPGEDPEEDDYILPSKIKAEEEYAFKLDPDIDHRSLLWTFDSIDVEADFEDFFERLPRLCDSKIGTKLELKEQFIKPNKRKLKHALIGLMDRTLKSDPVEEFVKHRRMLIFTKAIESKSTDLLHRSDIMRRVLFGDWEGLLGCMEFGLSMRNWAESLDKFDDKLMVESFYAQCIAALATSESLTRKRLGHGRHGGWIQMVKNLPVTTPFRPLVGHEHDDDILLTNAIFIVRITVQTYSGSEEKDWDTILNLSRRTLRAVCKLEHVQNTLAELRHEFCDLWNKLVISAQNDELPYRTVSLKMLKNIRQLYIALHSTDPQPVFNTTDDWAQILDNSEFYPTCNDDRHCSSSVTFPGLQFNAPPTQPAIPTQPTAPNQSAVPSSPPFPEPHIPTHHTLPTPSTTPGQRPPPEFPDPGHFLPPLAGNLSPTRPGITHAHPYVSSSAGSSSSPHAPSVPR